MADEDRDLLRLIAQDGEDLAIISAHMQDAVIRISDVAWLPGQARFAMLASRFDWMAAETGAMIRRQTGLHFDQVRHVTQSGIDLSNKDQILNLLSISFEAAEPPGGKVVLTFSGGKAICLDVECIEMQLRDMGAHWTTKFTPGHVETDGPPSQ